MANLALISLVFIFSSCNLIFSVDVDWSKRPRLSKKDYSQWFEPFYQNSSMPPEILESDYKPYIKALDNKKYADFKNKLNKRFNGDPKLISYMFIDMDDDGIEDWYWSDSSKSYVAGDQDLDNDGVNNFEDSDPYDPQIGKSDKDFDGIPDHLDWDKNNDSQPEDYRISKKLIRYQKDLYKSHKIIALNQDQYHDEKSLEAFKEILELVFKNVTNKNSGEFYNVKYLTARKGLEDSSTLAYYRESSSLITILDLGRSDGENSLFPRIIPMNFYATIIHELGHALEDYYSAVKFEDYIFETFYKDIFSRSEKSETWLYKGKTKKEWRDLGLDQIKTELEQSLKNYRYYVNSKEGVYNTFRSEVFSNNNIPTVYSLKSPGEHFCESLSAYALKTLIQNRFKGLEKDRMLRSVKRLIDVVEQEAGVAVTNIIPELEEFLEEELQLKKRLFFDREYEVDNFKKGRWVFLED